MIMQIKEKQAGDQRFNAPLAKGNHIAVIVKLKPPPYFYKKSPFLRIRLSA